MAPLGAALLGALGQPSLAQPGDLEALTRAAVVYRDAEDIRAVETVCGRCHAAGLYLETPRSYLRWEDVFARMSKHGATGTDAQLKAVIRYVDRNLTVVNANTSVSEELQAVLQISAQSAEEILLRRARAPFKGVSDLQGLVEIDVDRLRLLEARGLLQF